MDLYTFLLYVVLIPLRELRDHFPVSSAITTSTTPIEWGWFKSMGSDPPIRWRSTN